MVLVYWTIGCLIVEDEQKGKKEQFMARKSLMISPKDLLLISVRDLLQLTSNTCVHFI
jgi:hypothetical protein